MSHFTPLVTKKLLSKVSSCVMPEIARPFAHSMRHVNYSEKRLRLRGYPARFLLPVFREINYSNRSKWFSKPRRLSRHTTVVFKSTYNCSHVGIKKVILKHLPNLSSIISYKSTNTLAHLYRMATSSYF